MIHRRPALVSLIALAVAGAAHAAPTAEPPYPSSNSPEALRDWTTRYTDVPQQDVALIGAGGVFVLSEGQSQLAEDGRIVRRLRVEVTDPAFADRLGGRSFSATLKIDCPHFNTTLSDATVFPGPNLSGAPTRITGAQWLAASNLYLYDLASPICDRSERPIDAQIIQAPAPGKLPPQLAGGSDPPPAQPVEAARPLAPGPMVTTPREPKPVELRPAAPVAVAVAPPTPKPVPVPVVVKPPPAPKSVKLAAAPPPAPVKVAPAKPAPAKAAPTVSGPGAWVQAGAFATQAVARAQFEALSAKSATPLTGPKFEPVPDKPLVRLLIGPYPSRALANQACAALKTKGADCFVRP